MNVVHFDEAEHRYTVDGRRRMSVTQVIDAAGLSDYTFANEDAMKRGSFVHRAIEIQLTDKRGLDWNTVPEDFQPYVNGAIEYVADEHAEVVVSECRVFSAAYDFAGTLDAVLRVHVTCGPSCPEHAKRAGRLALIDWKSGAPQPWTALQTAAYALAYFELTRTLVQERWAVHVRADGSYKPTEYTDRSDRDRFLAALTVAKLRADWGLLKGDKAA